MSIHKSFEVFIENKPYVSKEVIIDDSFTIDNESLTVTYNISSLLKIMGIDKNFYVKYNKPITVSKGSTVDYLVDNQVLSNESLNTKELYLKTKSIYDSHSNQKSVDIDDKQITYVCMNNRQIDINDKYQKQTSYNYKQVDIHTNDLSTEYVNNREVDIDNKHLNVKYNKNKEVNIESKHYVDEENMNRDISILNKFLDKRQSIIINKNNHNQYIENDAKLIKPYGNSIKTSYPVVKSLNTLIHQKYRLYSVYSKRRTLQKIIDRHLSKSKESVKTILGFDKLINTIYTKTDSYSFEKRELLTDIQSTGVKINDLQFEKTMGYLDRVYPKDYTFNIGLHIENFYNKKINLFYSEQEIVSVLSKVLQNELDLYTSSIIRIGQDFIIGALQKNNSMIKQDMDTVKYRMIGMSFYSQFLKSNLFTERIIQDTIMQKQDKFFIYLYIIAIKEIGITNDVFIQNGEYDILVQLDAQFKQKSQTHTFIDAYKMRLIDALHDVMLVTQKRFEQFRIDMQLLQKNLKLYFDFELPIKLVQKLNTNMDLIPVYINQNQKEHLVLYIWKADKEFYNFLRISSIFDTVLQSSVNNPLSMNLMVYLI